MFKPIEKVFAHYRTAKYIAYIYDEVENDVMNIKEQYKVNISFIRSAQQFCCKFNFRKK